MRLSAAPFFALRESSLLKLEFLALLLEGGRPRLALEFSYSFAYFALCGKLASSSPKTRSTFLLWNLGDGEDIFYLLVSMVSLAGRVVPFALFSALYVLAEVITTMGSSHISGSWGSFWAKSVYRSSYFGVSLGILLSSGPLSLISQSSKVSSPFLCYSSSSPSFCLTSPLSRI